jgi:hypothetical protein
MSPTARSLKLLRDAGWLAGVVESWVPVANVRRDLFGFGDIIAIHKAEPGVLLVQATTRPNIGARAKKARALATLAIWLRDPGRRFEIWGFYQESSGKWAVKRVEITGDELRDEVLEVLEGPRRRRPDKQPDLFEGKG